jgi:hypothetical protein
MTLSYFLGELFGELFGFTFHRSDPIHMMLPLFSRHGSGSPEVLITRYPLAVNAWST